MNSFAPLQVVSVGMLSPVGLSAPACAAAIRAGITRVSESHIYDKKGEPLVMGLVRDEYLPPLTARLRERGGLTGRQERLLRLAAPALQQVCRDLPLPRPPPLLLAVPGPGPGHAQSVGPALLEQLAPYAQATIDLKHSRLIQKGRAGGLLALRLAHELLTSLNIPYVIVGGVDSYLDHELLATLDSAGRLRRESISDGFIPGEAAVFLLLSSVQATRASRLQPLARIAALGEGQEPGHLSSIKPYMGDGLADAFRELLRGFPSGGMKIQCVYAGLNGERFWSKEWGVAYLRHRECFAQDFRIEHPVEAIGDPGAALGPLLLGLAAIGVHRGYRSAPCLIWCSSDGEERAAALVDQERPL